MENEIELHDELMVVNFLKLPWTPVRAFTVTTKRPNRERGNHFAGSNQLIILVDGSAEFILKTELEAEKKVYLKNPGDHFYVTENTFLKYTLNEVGSTILVLSDQLFQKRSN